MVKGIFILWALSFIGSASAQMPCAERLFSFSSFNLAERQFSLSPNNIDDVKKVAAQVYALWSTGLDREAKDNLGGPDHPDTLERQIRNFKMMSESGEIPDRQRVNFGLPIWEIFANGTRSLVGYRVITRYKNANPNEYEKKYIRLREKMNYLQGRTLFIHQNSRSIGLGLLIEQWTWEQAQKLKLSLVVDVKAANTSIQSVLAQINMVRDREWKNPAGTRMFRFVRSPTY